MIASSRTCSFPTTHLRLAECANHLERGTLANIPLQLQIAGELAVTVLGTARHAHRHVQRNRAAKIPVATQSLLRDRSIAQIQFAQAEGLLRAARAYFYQVNDEVWRKGEAGASFSLKDRANVRLGIVTAVKLALQAMDLVADASGDEFRADLMSYRAMLARRSHRVTTCPDEHRRFEVVGRVLFGLPPGSPVI